MPGLHPLWPYLTLLGDARLLLPASGALFVWLWLRPDHRGAAAWLAAVAACLVLTVGAKLMFYKCGWWVGTYRLRSPSGHMSLGTTFFGVGLLLALRGKDAPLSLLGLAGVSGIVALIGSSRVALIKHTIPEVVAGGVIGIACIGLFWQLWTRSRFHVAAPRLLPVALGLVLGGVLLFALESGAEPIIRSIAFGHTFSTGLCDVVPLPR